MLPNPEATPLEAGMAGEQAGGVGAAGLECQRNGWGDLIHGADGNKTELERAVLEQISCLFNCNRVVERIQIGAGDRGQELYFPPNMTSTLS